VIARGDWLVGVDIGAGSLKTMAVRRDGRVGGSASVDIATHTPRAGWSEQHPKDWWDALCATVPRALSEAGIGADAVAAIAFSAGAHTPVLEDASGNVLRPAILWSDQRSADEARELESDHGDEILALGCNRAVPTWTQPQLLWLARHEPDVLARTRRLYVAKDWLRSRLTGTWETDHTEAVGTLLCDGRRARWSERLCAMIGFDPSRLPPIVRPSSVVGEVTRTAASATGFAAGTPVVCGSSDTSVEVYGAGAIAPGEAAVKLATAATVSIVGREPRVHRSVINYPFAVPGLWYTIGATNSCASAHRWLRDRFFMASGGDGAEAFAEMDRLASTVPAGAGGLLFHPYLNGERTPHWDPLLRADFVGMTFRHERGHFVRALYEGIAYSLRDVLEALRGQGLDAGKARIIGGGARSATWRQIVCDVLGIAIEMPRVTDASFGAALIAGVGIGMHASEVDAARASVEIVARHEPDASLRPRYEAMYGIYRDSAAATAGISHRLAAIDRS